MSQYLNSDGKLSRPLKFTKYYCEEIPGAGELLDGYFLQYATIQEFPRENMALTLLRTLAAIVRPIMTRHKVKIDLLSELDYQAPMHGFNKERWRPDASRLIVAGRRDTMEVSIKLRHRGDPAVFLPLDRILSSVLHELAHCWCGDHGLQFLRKWRDLIDEVQIDLGGKIRIPYGASVYEAQLRWLSWEDDTASKEKTHDSCPRAIQAARNWETKHWGFKYIRMDFKDEIGDKFDQHFEAELGEGLEAGLVMNLMGVPAAREERRREMKAFLNAERKKKFIAQLKEKFIREEEDKPKGKGTASSSFNAVRAMQKADAAQGAAKHKRENDGA